MNHSIQQVQPPLHFIPPAFNPTLFGLIKTVFPVWSRTQLQLTQVQAHGVEQLVDLYQQFQAGKGRLMLAFRHPSTNDPACMANLLWYQVPQVARQMGVTLQQPTHAHFLYDRGIPLWAGPWVGWLYAQMGCTPIHRGKIDRQGLKSARELFANGRFPIAAAPEGATNGHNEIISPLEPGVAQMAFWCVEDLVKANRTEPVYVVPIGIQYRYVAPPWQALDRLLSQLEADCGIASPVSAVATSHLPIQDAQITALYQRLYRLGEHLLTLMEQFYTQFYHQSLTATEEPTPRSFTKRLQVLLDVALKVAEQYFDVPPKGSVIDRCRRLEQAGWDWIYREDIKNLEALSPVERSLADRIAEEASLRMWHMRLVESFVAVTGRYVVENPTAERFAETTLLVWDMIARIQGKPVFPKPRLGPQTATVTVGTPIAVSDRWETYQVNRRTAKQAVADLTQDIQTAFESMIV